MMQISLKKNICFKIQIYFGNLIMLKKGKNRKSSSPKANRNSASKSILDFTLYNQEEKRYTYPLPILQYQVYLVEKSKNNPN